MAPSPVLTKLSVFVVVCLTVMLWWRQFDMTHLAKPTATLASDIVKTPPVLYVPEQEQVLTVPSIVSPKADTVTLIPPSQPAEGKPVVDECASIWLPDKLVGRCFGLKDFFTYPELIHVSSVNKSAECQALCCDLKSCVSWQYWAGLKVCKLGGPARLGGEGGQSANWCEPLPPLKWSGQLKNASVPISARGDERGATCGWVKDLPSQCFGLGMERKIDNVRMTSEQCQQSCCADSKCMMYQHADDKGCFHDSGGDGKNFCEEYMGPFDGGRKCRPQDGCPPDSRRLLRTNYY